MTPIWCKLLWGGTLPLLIICVHVCVCACVSRSADGCVGVFTDQLKVFVQYTVCVS